MKFFEPGTSTHPVVIRSLNVILALLLVTLAIIVLEGYGNIHVYIMMVLTIGLVASMNLFVITFIYSSIIPISSQRIAHNYFCINI